eukprot:TRINITY_DN20813_c0_g4_i1.p1 TRINITY_DN20813_c0_g4~~TRINITY_DN20813_c0_g4_i1.p1  ORF type:complete len:1238 (-),score=222.75 TRINITY_DN20813_c0_g4_i1:24-3695(-)
MLGCVGSRDKSGAQSSVLPLQAWAVSPRIDKVVFEFGLQFTGCKALDFESVSVTVQMLEAGTLTSSWVALPGARWRPLDPSVVSEAGRAALGIGHDEAGWEESRKFLSNGSLLRSSLTSQPRGDDGEGDGPVPKDVAVGTKETEASPFSIAADGSAGSGAPADSASASGGVANVGDGAAANVCDSPAVSSVAASGAMFSAAGDGVNDAPTATASFLPSVDAAITNALRGEIRVVKIGCSAEVSGLRPEKDYTLQVLARGSPRETYASCEPFVCRTADRPSLTTCQLTRVYRWADGVEVEWVVPDPAGAPVEECSALCRIESLLSSWAEAESEFATVEVLPQNPGAVQLVPGETEKRGRRWRGFIHGLKGATSYYVRARARNAVGWSLNTSPDLQLATSDMPPSPTELATIGRRPTSVVLSFVMHDPEGSPVETCAAQIRGLMGYVPHPNCRWEHTRPAADEDGRYPKGERRALCIMQGLSPEQSYVVRLWTQNGSGTSKTPSVALQVSTSERPAAPSQLSAKVGPRAIEVEWDLVDPLGAPVEIGFETSRPPPAARQLKVFRNEMNGLIVNAVVDDPDGAPVVACMVKCREQGLWALARRDGSVNGSWRATLSVLGGSESSNENAVTAALVAAGSRVTIIVRAANSVGWSEGSVCEKPEFLSQEADDGNALADVVPRDGSNSGQDSGLDLVVKEVQRAIERQRESKVRINKLLAQASSRGDHEHAASLARHCVEIERRMEVLQQVAQHVDPSLEPVASATPAAEDQGVQIVSQIQAEMKKHNLLPNAPAAAKVLALLLRGYIWLETVWRSELSFLSAGISQAMEAVPETGSRILHQWAKRHQSWSESFNRKVNAALPEGLATATQLLSTLVSGRKLELFKTVRSDMEACTTLLAAAERQLRKLRQSYRILHAAEAASCHKFEGKGVLQKIETTALGLITMMVLPVPGSLEVGTVGIAMLWLEGDMAGSHLALQHPSGTLLGPMLQRLGSCPPPRAAVILAGWASGGHRGVVLVHNATARRITVTALSDVQSLGSRAFSKLSEAHPMVRMLGPAMNLADGGDHVVTILPTDVALIQVPDTGGPGGDTVKLEFAYGPSAHMEKAMGRAVVKPGTAVSFMHLDGTLQVSNIEGDNTSVEEGTVTVINNELAQCSVSLFRAPEAQKHFESPLQVEILQPGEEKQLPVPHPCIGRIFQVEVKDDTNHKSICEVRPGQRLVIECCGTPA